ncbi:hypothetical protein FS749_016224 [Ceratobasidium sp. UAMH 11750]|nr:hypothetical protein FS749_016224 [Ceratobasidium sp. UAMH 11750]
MYSMYGLETDGPNDIFLQKLRETVDNTSKALLPSNFLVNAFPALARVPDWLPGTGWKRITKEWREKKDDTVDSSPYNWAKSEMGKHAHEPSIVESMLSQVEQLGIDPEEADSYVKEAAFALVGGATDSTVGAAMIFFVAMILIPEVQAKAQEEIDLVTGVERLPEMKDRSQLPYIGRLIQEVLRWRSVVPIGMPHASYQDDIYKGYRIPKGAIVFGNIYHNPNAYKNPETFEPDRFLDPSVAVPPAFGLGRRACPGMYYAQSSLYILFVSILAVFRVEMARDENGNDIVPVAEGENKAIL